MKRNVLWRAVVALSVGLLVTAPSMARGAEPGAGLNDHAKVVDRVAKTPEGEQRVAEQLSQELHVPAATLRAQREQFKIGWGSLSIAYRLSQATGVPVGNIVAAHQSGKGWGLIAKEHNLNLGALVSEAKKSAEAVDKADKAAKDKAAADKAARDKADKSKDADVAGGRGGGNSGTGGHGGGGAAGGASGGAGGGGGGGGGGGKK